MAEVIQDRVKDIRLSEVFLGLKKRIKKADKIAWLQKYAGFPLFYVLWLIYGGKAEWLLPEGAPPYKPYEGFRGRSDGAPSTIARELRRFYLFLKGTGDTLNQLKREKIFQQMLEEMPPAEAELFIAIKDGTAPKTYKCSKAVVEEAFPGIFNAPFTNHYIDRQRA